MEKREVLRGDRGIEERGVGGGKGGGQGRGRHILGIGQNTSQGMGWGVGSVITGNRDGVGASRLSVYKSRAYIFRISGSRRIRTV